MTNHAPVPSLPDISDEAAGFLWKLLDTAAPSSFEEPSAGVFADYAQSFADISTDAVGNTFAVVNKGARRRVLVTGHLDEIGLIVSKIDDDGFLRCVNIGGWDIGVLIGQRVRILGHNGVVHGCICRGAVHTLDADARGKMPKLKDLWLDIGAESQEEARAHVRVGDPAVLDAYPRLLGKHRLMSRALDDRLGAFIAIEAARAAQGLDVEVVALGAVQEEIFGPGAQVGAFSAQPDAAVAIDVTAPSDTPGGLEGHDFGLGKGPVITRGATTNLGVGNQLIDVAKAQEIPHQLRGLGTRTGTDVDKLVFAGAGVACGLISVPTRYLHSPCEVADVRDVVASINLLTAWIGTYASGAAQ